MNDDRLTIKDAAQFVGEKKMQSAGRITPGVSGTIKKVVNAVEEHLWRRIILGTPFLWMLVFFLLPFLYVLQISLTELADARPPYSEMFSWVEDTSLSIKLIFDNYRVLLEDDLYVIAYFNSVKIAFLATISCLAIGYTMAYGIARATPKWRNILLLAVMMPFWTSFLLRVYAWMGLLANHGIVNNVLIWIGVIEEPLQIMYTDTAMYVVFIYAYLPFMILPLYANLEKLDPTLDEAAADLGAGPVTVFLTITLPLSLPGIIAGCMLTFIPAVGEFVVPILVGGPENLMIGRVLYDEFLGNIDWPMASAVATVLLLLLVLPFMVYTHFNNKLKAELP